ncbi:MAG: hypothetical protein M3Y59_15040 [Myxococcota bacterium]|nr:hypothetical protein [Myxococcota bacterium]
MQVVRWVLVVGLAAAWAGCDRGQEATPREGVSTATEGESAPVGEGASAVEDRPGVDAAAPAEPLPMVDGHPVPGVPLEELRAGLSRDALMSTVGDCVERVKLIKPTPARMSLEVFQPKDSGCEERLGKRHFVVVGNTLQSIEQGLRSKPSDTPRAPRESDRLQ